MKKTRKSIRSLSLAVVFCLLAAFLPMTGGSGTFTAYADGDFIIENGVLTKYNGSGGDVVIPSGVTEIGEKAFNECESVTSVTIPDGVKKIGRYAFSYCVNMHSVTIPDSVKEIAQGAFFCCRSLTDVALPDSLSTLDNDVFYDCSSLESMTIPEGVGFVSGNLFCLCSSLKSVTIPKSAISIGVQSFYGCTSLTSVTIPASVMTVYDKAFYHCTALETVDILQKSAIVFSDAFEGTAVKTVNFAGTEAEWNVSDWEERLGAATVTYNYYPDLTIVDGMLTKYKGSGGYVTIPSTVTTIGGSVFANCTSLTGVTIPDSVTTIGESAFSGCSSLNDVTIPASVTTIGKYCFDNCSSLTAINVASGSASYCSMSGVLFNKEMTTLIRYPEAKSGTSYTIPDTVTTVGNSAFCYCNSLQSIVMPASLKTVEDYALYGCASLQSVTIPAKVTTVGKFAFTKNAALKTVTINAKFPSVHAYAFQESPVKNVYYAGSEDEWKASNWSAALSYATVHYDCDPDFIIEDGVLTQYTGAGGNVVIPDGVTAIGNKAFYYCTSLTGVTIPDGVTSIGNQAFYYCTSLTDVTIPDGVTSIGSYAFYRCEYLASVTIPGSVTSIGKSAFDYCESLTSVTIPDSVTTIDDFAFDSCTSLTSVTLPASVTSLGDWVFDDCSSLTVINVASGNANYCSVDGVLFNKDKTKIIRYPEAKSGASYTIPATVTTIGSAAFYECDALKTVIIPDSVTAIKDYAFEYCDTIESITIPANVTSVGEFAFAECSSLKIVTILAKSPEVDSNAFNNTPVETVNYAGSKDEWNASDWKDAFGSAITVKYSGSSLAITQQPKNQSIIAGKSLTLSVKATGSGLKYQWYFKKKGQSSFSVWNGRTNATETVSPNNTWDGIQLYCKVTDASGKTVNSNTVTASVLSITTQPGSQTIALGSPVTVSVAATGSGLKYQWYYKKAGQSSFSVWNSRTKASETVTPNDTWNGIQIYCKVTDGAGNSVNSNPATITIGSDIAITQQPKSQSIIAGKSLTLSVKATGDSLKYQWYFKKKGQSSFSVWNSRTNATETVSPGNTWDGIQLYCKITDNAGKTVNSNTATISVLSITTQPKSQTVTLGNAVTLSVKATGSGLKYQWYFKKKGASSFSVWNSRTKASETVTPNDSWNGIQLYCKVTDSAGNSVNSNPATITIGSGITITQQPKNQSIVAGKSLTLTVKATGSGLKYQWYFKKKGQSSFSVWNSRTNATETVTPNNTWDGIQIYCKITDASGKTVNSNTVTISVLSITTQPKSQTVTLGNAVTLSVKATGSGLSYQWYFKKKGASEFSIWNGRTKASETVTPNASWNGIQIYCVVKDGAGNMVKSETATITVK